MPWQEETTVTDLLRHRVAAIANRRATRIRRRPSVIRRRERHHQLDLDLMELASVVRGTRRQSVGVKDIPHSHSRKSVRRRHLLISPGRNQTMHRKVPGRSMTLRHP